MSSCNQSEWFAAGDTPVCSSTRSRAGDRFGDGMLDLQPACFISMK